eukprot:TRINITY_DN2741_c0_g1_i1.p2 TRINITY_DN2741_c0_g1~~TRINITY_DN2741_c0_g1_i1.p2  ORF type:complete len:187 (-),score=15.09 TRINITY_DN2741_c0_g1_i1:57-617(-)
MGAIFGRFKKKKSKNVLLVGLDSAGKTSILYHFKIGETVTTIPTIGVNVETVTHRGLDLVFWDCGGQDRLRGLWAQYFKQSDAIAFVVDSADVARVDDELGSSSSARTELHKILDAEELKGKPLIVLCNKQDLPNALSPNEVTERLAITKLTDRDWTVQATCALGGDGLALALDWLVDTVSGAQNS